MEPAAARWLRRAAMKTAATQEVGIGMLLLEVGIEMLLLGQSLFLLWLVEVLNFLLFAAFSAVEFADMVYILYSTNDWRSVPGDVLIEKGSFLAVVLGVLLYFVLELATALKLSNRAFMTLFAIACVLFHVWHQHVLAKAKLVARFFGFVADITAPASHLRAESLVHPYKDNPEQPTFAVLAPAAALPLTSPRRGGGKVGIRGAGLPVLFPPLPITALAPPLARRLFVADDMNGSAWGIVNSFAPKEEKSEPGQAHEHSDACPISDIEDRDEGEDGPAAVEGEPKEMRTGETVKGFVGISSLSTTNGEDVSISPNGKFKRKIMSWRRGALLGSGSFGRVYEGISDDGAFFAVKEVSLLDQKSVCALEQEIALLSQFEHENIVQYCGTGKDESNLYIFMELVTKGSLVSLYQKYKLRESQVSAYTRQILNGLVYLHERNVVHRDIKCANILVHANGSVKLADFGLAKVMPENMLGSCKGTVYWMAPEVINPKKTYGLSADIWSLGCTVLEMLTGQVPFPNEEWISAGFRILRGAQPPIPNKLSKEAQDFIGQCVRVDPEERPSAAELLEHPFVHGPRRA